MAPVRSAFVEGIRCVVLAAALSFPAVASAQDIATAEALFKSGLADMEAGRYEKGCKALVESQRLDPRAGTLFTLATCEERWGRLATAVLRFEDFILLYERLPEDRRAPHAARYKVAVETRDRLRLEVPRWTLSLPPDAPKGTVVKRDGEIVPEPALGLSMTVDPGEHVLTVEAPGRPPLEKKVTIARGQTLTLTLEVPSSKSPAPVVSAAVTASPTATPKSPPPEGPGVRRTLVYALGGAGVAGVIAGGILGGLVLGNKGTIDAHCGAAIGEADPSACDATGLDAGNAARDLGLGSTIAFSAGGAALAAAVILFVTEPKSPPPRTGKQAVSISVAPLRFGPEGAQLGVRGAF